MVLYGTGMRRAELARLKIAHIDSQRMIIHVVDGKGHKDRDLPLSPALLDTLRAFWRWLKPRTWLFPSRMHRDREQPISDKAVSGLPVSIRHLLSLMPKSPLPEVSDEREREVAARQAG